MTRPENLISFHPTLGTTPDVARFNLDAEGAAEFETNPERAAALVDYAATAPYRRVLIVTREATGKSRTIRTVTGDCAGFDARWESQNAARRRAESVERLQSAGASFFLGEAREC